MMFYHSVPQTRNIWYLQHAIFNLPEHFAYVGSNNWYNKHLNKVMSTMSQKTNNYDTFIKNNPRWKERIKVWWLTWQDNLKRVSKYNATKTLTGQPS